MRRTHYPIAAWTCPRTAPHVQRQITDAMCICLKRIAHVHVFSCASVSSSRCDLDDPIERDARPWCHGLFRLASSRIEVGEGLSQTSDKTPPSPFLSQTWGRSFYLAHRILQGCQFKNIVVVLLS